MESSSVFWPWSTCDRYRAAIATFTVLAIGNGVSPLILMLLARVEVERSDPDVGRAAGNQRTELLFDPP